MATTQQTDLGAQRRPIEDQAEPAVETSQQFTATEVGLAVAAAITQSGAGSLAVSQSPNGSREDPLLETIHDLQTQLAEQKVELDKTRRKHSRQRKLMFLGWVISMVSAYWYLIDPMWQREVVHPVRYLKGEQAHNIALQQLEASMLAHEMVQKKLTEYRAAKDPSDMSATERREYEQWIARTTTQVDKLAATVSLNKSKIAAYRKKYLDPSITAEAYIQQSNYAQPVRLAGN